MLFLLILPKLHFISTPFMYLVTSIMVAQSGCRSWVRTGLVLEFFCFPATRSWVRTSPSPYFFRNKRVAENIPVLSGRLVALVLYLLTGSTFHRLRVSNVFALSIWRKINEVKSLENDHAEVKAFSFYKTRHHHLGTFQVVFQEIIRSHNTDIKTIIERT